MGAPNSAINAIPCVLVDSPLETMHALRKNLEKTIQDAMPLLGPELFSEVHRTFDIRKHDGDLFAFTLQRGFRL